MDPHPANADREDVVDKVVPPGPATCVPPDVLKGIQDLGLEILPNTHVRIPPRDGLVLLHVGAGREYWPMYTNIDIDSRNKLDLCVDMKLLEDHFRPNEVDGVVSIHCFPYLNVWEQKDWIQSVHRILKPGGKLVLQHPDSEIILVEIYKRRGDLDFLIDAMRGCHAFDINDIIKKRAYPPYQMTWPAWGLAKVFALLGFSAHAIDLKIEPQNQGWRDSVVVGVKA